jgi:hypothetical protein
MRFQVLLPAIVVAMLPVIAVTSAFAQNPPDPGGAISVPLPPTDKQDPKKYEIPELAGAVPADGSQLVDDRLPEPIADYVVRVGQHEQSLTLFSTGLVVIRMRGIDGGLLKKIVIPADALAEYRKHLTRAALEEIQPRSTSMAFDRDFELIRIYTGSTYVERRLAPNLILPAPVQLQRKILHDLFSAIAYDRDVSAPLVNYVPVIGDELVAEDQRVYLIKRIIDGRVVELVCRSEPTSMYVDARDLHLYFVAVRPKRQK